MTRRTASSKAKAYIERIMKDPRIVHVAETGSLRREVNEPKDVDLVVVVLDPAAYLSDLKGGMRPPEVDFEKEHADVFLATPDSFGAVLAFSTGPRLLNRKLEMRAEAMGLELRSDGLYVQGDLVITPTEESFFQALGVSWYPPSERDRFSAVFCPCVGVTNGKSAA